MRFFESPHCRGCQFGVSRGAQWFPMTFALHIRAFSNELVFMKHTIKPTYAIKADEELIG